MKIQSFTLANKLKVLLFENHKAPVVTIQSWVRTGSADEQKGQEGLSHFIEHLLFKGTRKYKVGEIAQLIEGAGGDLNAYTSFDQTVFYMTLSSQYTDLGLDAMSEMMGHPNFDPVEVDNEREVVIEEIKRTNDSPTRRSSYLLFSSLYGDHGYGRPVIGYPEVVKNTPANQIKKLYFERYCPENMFLLVVGDFDSKVMKKKIQKQFSSLKGKLKKYKRSPEKLSADNKIMVEKAPFQESYLNLAWQTFDASEDEIVGLELLSYILSHGDNTRLIQNLRLKKAIVNEIGAYQFDAKDPGFFSISVHFDFKNLDEILDKVTDEIILLLVNTVNEAEIDKAVTQMESSEYYQETMDGLARKFGNNQFQYHDPEYFAKFIQKLKKQTPAKLSMLVKKYFSPERLKISAIYPDKEANPESTIALWREDFANAFNGLREEKPILIPDLNFATTKLTAPIKHVGQMEREFITTPDGAKIVLCPLPETGVVSARIGFLGGLRADIPRKEGGFELMSKAWLSGTATKSEEQISEILEISNAHVGSFSGRNSFGLEAQMLNSNEKDISKLFSDVLIAPLFPDHPFDREKEILVRQVQNLVDHPSALVFEDFMKCLFGEHPYSREVYGTAESLGAVGAADVRKLYKKYGNSSNATMVISGGFDRNYWRDYAQELIAKLPKGEKFDKKFNHDVVANVQRTFRALKKEQSHIVYGFRGISIFDPDKYALQVLQTVLSGQGGRLFMNLRDKASLAYSVSPVRMDGIETGYFGAYIGCSPEKGEKAVGMIKDEFDRLVAEKIPAEELDRAQKNIIGKQDISLQKTNSVTSQVLFDEIYGIPSKMPEEFRQKILSVTPAQILKLSQRLFSQQPVISCVGSICPW